VVVSSISRCLTVSDGGAGQEGDAIRFVEAGRFATKVVEILRYLKEGEHVMCLTDTLHSMTTLAAWAVAERTEGS